MQSFAKQNDSEVTKKSLGSPKWSEKEDYPVPTLWLPLVNRHTIRSLEVIKRQRNIQMESAMHTRGMS